MEVVRGVLVEPARFFAGLGGPRPDRVKGPLIFAIICGLISFPLALIVEPYDPLASGQPGLRSGFFSLFRDNPAVALALAAVFVFLFVRERRGYWGTFPVVAYGAALSLVLLDPDSRLPGEPLRRLHNHGRPERATRDEYDPGPAGGTRSSATQPRRGDSRAHLLPPQNLTSSPPAHFHLPESAGRASVLS